MKTVEKNKRENKRKEGCKSVSGEAGDGRRLTVQRDGLIYSTRLTLRGRESPLLLSVLLNSNKMVITNNIV